MTSLTPKLRLFSVVSVLFGSSVAFAQGTPAVLITEVVPDPVSNGSAEWVEIHNTEAMPVDISGWLLLDHAGASFTSFEFPANTTLAAGQVIIVARDAALYATEATMQNYPMVAATADYEIGLGGDDPAVPNLINPMGTFALGNGSGGVELQDAMGATISTVEWNGGVAAVVGNPVTGLSDPDSALRVNTTGDSVVDFVVGTPDPGTGFVGVQPTPPIITNPVRAPATVAFGQTFTVSATVTDADGVAESQLFVAIATAAGGDADTAYVPLTMTANGGYYTGSGTVNNLDMTLTFADPATFNERYIRYYVRAADTTMSGATSPTSATPGTENTEFYWENILPSAAVTDISAARAQDAMEVPLFEHHSVRIEGVALTTDQAFATNSTNFFVAAQTGVDAIRIFDNELLAMSISPGDIVRVTGKIGVFRGVRQVGRDERGVGPDTVGPEITVEIIGNAMVPMVTADIATILAAGEDNESQLIRINGAQFVADPNNGDPVPMNFSDNSTLYINDGTGDMAVRIAATAGLDGQPVPMGMFDMVGIFTQFAPAGTGGYQVQPRDGADLITGMPPVDGGVPDNGMMEMDAGVVDMGEMPPVDMGEMPPVDMGVNPPVDMGVTPPVDMGGGSVDTGSAVGVDSGTFGMMPEDDGCSCSQTPANEQGQGGLWLALFVLGLLPLRRRR